MPQLMNEEQLEALIRECQENTAELRRIRVRIQKANQRAAYRGVDADPFDADAVEDWNKVTEEALA